MYLVEWIPFDDRKFYNSHTVINCVKWELLKGVDHTTVKRNINDKRIQTSKLFDYLYLLSILNSKLINWYFLMFLSESLHFYPADAKQLPLKNASKNQQAVFVNIVQYIILLKGLTAKNQLNLHVPNTHIAQVFEEVMDAMVMELYFKEDFKKAEIAFIKYAEWDFESIEGKSEEEQIQIIQKAYQKLREKDNEIRNNLKLMDIKLADIVGPIKAGK